MLLWHDCRLREMIGILGTFVLVVNIVAYIGGYMFIDFNVRYAKTQRQQIVEMTNAPVDLQANEEILALDPEETGNAVGGVESTSHSSRPQQKTDNAVDELEFLIHSFHPRKVGTTTEGPPIQQTTTNPATVTSGSGVTANFLGSPHAGSTTPGPSLAEWREHYRRTVIQSNEPCRYEKSRSSTEGRWYNFTSGTVRFYAYTAFLDDRPSLKTDPVVRIIALSTTHELHTKGVELLCDLHYETAEKNGHHRRIIVPMERSPRGIGHGWPLNDEKVREYIYTCPLKGDAVSSGVPIAVSVVTNRGDFEPAVTSCMPVERPMKPATPSAVEDFAICVQVAYDNVDPYRLIEWFELQRLLGVTLVGVYNLSVTEPASKVLRHYAAEGFVDLRKTDYIAHGPQQYLLHGSPVINDCVYRHMYRFRRMLVIDFDETILPRAPNTNLNQLAVSMENSFRGVRSAPPVNYIFQNNYFFLESTPDVGEDARFPIQRYRQRAPISPMGYSAKSIIDPQSCIQMHNHYCWNVTAGFEDRGYIAFVSADYAVNQHYKSCHFSSFECRSYLEQSTRDDAIEPFKARLEAAIDNKIKLIYQ